MQVQPKIFDHWSSLMKICLITALFAMAIAGCGGGQTASDTGASSDQSASVTGSSIDGTAQTLAGDESSLSVEADGAGNAGGLKAEYFSNIALTGSPVATRTDPEINFDWASGAPSGVPAADNFSVRWTGQVITGQGSYVFATRSDDGVRVWIDGNKVIDQWNDHATTLDTQTLVLSEGTHEIRMEYYERGGLAVAQLLWQPPGTASLVPIPTSALSPSAATPPPAVGSGDAANRLFYAGEGGLRFNDVHRLSDGTVLIAGQATSLAWLPPSVPRTTLAAGSIASSSPGNIGFVLHASGDLSQVLDVASFPAGTVRDVYRIRSTEVPGQPTGAVYLSGSRDGASPGYFIARLDANWVNARPTALAWSYDASAGAGSAYQTLQPWDVGADGEVVFGSGREYGNDWAVMQRLSATGALKPVENWTAHWSRDAGANTEKEWNGTPASAYPGPGSITYSGLVLKAGRRGSLRSASQSDFDLLQVDGNGNAGRRGRYPDDYYFTGPCLLPAGSACAGSGGYTGYRVALPTQRLGGIAIDRNTGNVYFGYSTQTVSVDGPDFESAVVAMSANGSLLWWNRLYRETAARSTPDQFVDSLAIDYANQELVVLARSHGNNNDNLWQGQGIAARPGLVGYQRQFTGSNGNITVSWLGKFALARNELHAATFIGEFVEGSNNYGDVFSSGPLAGWPNPNSGWPNLNTTRNCNDLDVGPDGAVAVVCQGRRSATTNNAHQKMPSPVGSTASRVGAWNYFVRVYAPDLSSVRYSSLVTGAWDQATGAGGDNTLMSGVSLAADRVLVVGAQAECAKVGGTCTTELVSTKAAKPNPLPVVNVPAWGQGTALRPSGVMGAFKLTP